MIRRLSLLFVFLLPLAGLCSVPDDEEDPYFLLCGQADAAIAKADYSEAAARLIDAISIRPNAPESVLLMSNLGMVYSYMGRDTLALATLDEALRRAPAMRTVALNRGKVLLKLKRDKDARDAFDTVISADSTNMEARFYRGSIALYHGQLDVAKEDFEVLKSKAPNSSETAQALSSLYLLTGEYRKAIPYFQRLIDTEESSEYYAGLASCQLSLGNLSEASEVLAKGISKFPDDAELYYYRAMLNRDRYRLDDAHADASRAIRLGLNPAKAKALFQ